MFERGYDVPPRRPPPFAFGFPGDGFPGAGYPPREDRPPSPVIILEDIRSYPRGRLFNTDFGPFTEAEINRIFGFPDRNPRDSWDPVGGGRSPSPGFIVSEDGVPLSRQTPG